MGRPRLYHSTEDRLAAAAARSREYYEKNKEAICAARRAKRLKTPTTNGVSCQRTLSTRSRLTEEEKKHKNRLKAKHYYERNKSTIRRRRQMKRPQPLFEYCSGMTATSNARGDEILRSFCSELSNLLKSQGVAAYLESVAIDYIKTGFRDPLEAAAEPFVELQGRLRDHLLKRRDQVADDVYYELGTTARLSDIEKRLNNVHKLLREVKDIVLLLEDLIIVSLEHDHVEGFVGVYENHGLSYQCARLQ